MSSGENRIVLDWDGTLVPQEWPAHPQMTAEAVSFVETLLHEGWEVVIHSTRLAPFAMDEVTPLKPSAIRREYRYIRSELDRNDFFAVEVWTEPWKPGARWYIDDKAIPFTGSWRGVLDHIERGAILEEEY